MKRTMITTLPTWMQATGQTPAKDDPPHWSSKAPPPAIGAEIEVGMNGIGPGRVAGYYVIDGFLGLAVVLLTPPKWFIVQRQKDKVGVGEPALVFGIELKVPAAAPMERA
jgi:hypothetical protein